MTVIALAGACSTRTTSVRHSAAAQQPQLAATEKTKSDGSPLEMAVSALEAQHIGQPGARLFCHCN